MSTFWALHLLLSRRKILNHLVHNPWLFNQNTRGRGNDSLCSYSVILWSNSKEVNERSASLFWTGVGGGSVVMRSLTSSLSTFTSNVHQRRREAWRVRLPGLFIVIVMQWRLFFSFCWPWKFLYIKRQTLIFGT